MTPRSAIIGLAMFHVFLLSTWAFGQATPASGSPVPGAPVWPRTFQKDGVTVVVYQPQIDSWKDYDKIRFRDAVAVTTHPGAPPAYGVLAVQADTLVDHDARMVLMTNVDPAIRFPGASAQEETQLKQYVKECLPSRQYLDVSLDEVLAYMRPDTKARQVDVSLAPPPIYYSDVPAILVIYLGQPQFRPVEKTGLMFAVNTNWVVLMDEATSQYYLLDNESWLTSPDPLKGPWTSASKLPAGFSQLPQGGNWDEVRKSIPGKPAGKVPRVITATKPAELIVTVGPPNYTPIPGTRLMYVSNPQMPLFFDLEDGKYYYLDAGRWFRAADITGPWSEASKDLPAEFAKIPPESPLGFVLASVPGTQEARDAVLLAQVPHKATIKIADAKLSVAYDGPPKFAPIQGTAMEYAVNTAYEVIKTDSLYFCCYDGVWFDAASPAGPWSVCKAVPQVIYTIPSSSPLYNATYVQVYNSTPDAVVVGYTGGYSGQYVAATGAVMFGAGIIAGAAMADNWYQVSPCYYSYGCAAHYSYAYGGYYRAAGAYYGPHGGAGWGAAYNPATGTWARAGYAYGPAGEHWGAQAYNPFTNTYAEHTGGTSGYQSWGQTAVSQDGKWAEAGHVSGPAGSAGWAETSSGKWAAGAHAGDSTVAKTSSGDVYAGHDGNVYRNTGDGWQKYQGGGSWSDAQTAVPHSQAQQQVSGAEAEGNWQSAMQNRERAGTQSEWAKDWQSGQANANWKSSWENRPAEGAAGDSYQNRWSQHDTVSGLNQDAWARARGGSNAASSWQSRAGGFQERGGGFGGGGGRGRR